MRQPDYSTQFRRDVIRAEKRGKDMGKLKQLLSLPIPGESLPAQCRDHPLKLNWQGYRDAHIEPDWLLISFADEKTVRFERIGTHSDLFD